MTHPFIKSAMAYRNAQAIVLREAEEFVSSGNPEQLVAAVGKLKECREKYKEEKGKAFDRREEDP